MTVTRYFTAKEVVAFTGVTYRRLDCWIRSGIIRSSGRDSDGRGSRRLFTFSDLVEIRVVKELTQRGLRLAVLRQCLRQFRKKIPSLVSVPLSSLRLVTDGKTVFQYVPEGDRLESLEEFGQFAFAFDVGEELSQMQEAVLAFPRPKRRDIKPVKQESDARVKVGVS